VRQETDSFGKTLYDTAASDKAVVDAVGVIANARSVSRAQVALAWIANKHAVTSPIVGASKPQHLIDAVAALALQLTTEEIAQLESPYTPHRLAGF
jgi:aryl-alcohol dehydrogenase-like predicted oxidoreductase